MPHRYDWICDNFAYVLASILTAMSKYQPELDFVKEVFEFLNTDMIIAWTFTKALFTFILMKFFDVTIGRKVKNVWHCVIDKIKKLW